MPPMRKRAIRNIRAEAEASPKKKLTAFIVAKEAREKLEAGRRYICDMANITEITFADDRKDVPEDVMTAVIDGAEIFIPLDELVDFEAEKERLAKEKKRLEGEVARTEKMLSNPGFVNKAPEKKIAEEKEKQAKYKDMLEKVCERLSMIEEKLK